MGGESSLFLSSVAEMRGFWWDIFILGALLEEIPKEGEGLKFQGSAMVALASSKEEVLEKLKSDIYAKSEVWDFSKVSFVVEE